MIISFSLIIRNLNKWIFLYYRERKCKHVCCDEEKRVIDCYQANRTTSLNCSSEVRNFMACAQQSRLVSSVLFLFPKEASKSVTCYVKFYLRNSCARSISIKYAVFSLATRNLNRTGLTHISI